MAVPRNVTDGSTKPPRLAIYGSEWGLLELPRLPHDRVWTFEETAEKLAAAGFDGIQTCPQNQKVLAQFGLRYATAGRVNTVSEVAPHIQSAADTGADCTTLHVGWGMESDAEIDALVDTILAASARYNLPAYVETHRATIAQDTWRISQFIARHPDVRFNGDFSHLYCGNEVTYPGFANFRHHFLPILERTSFLHARISNAESMQVDVGDGFSNPHAQNFLWLWETVLRAWCKHARSGDLFPFTPELGPPSSGYSITYTTPDGRLTEISDRWQQTLVLCNLGQHAWTKALTPS
ncbi:MAG: hypothetical protein WCI73_09405 [Phycisphaerae bacterium]